MHIQREDLTLQLGPLCNSHTSQITGDFKESAKLITETHAGNFSIENQNILSSSPLT